MRADGLAGLAHPSMHPLHSLIGHICRSKSVPACRFDYDMLHRKHWEHHTHTGVPHMDPDFHRGNPNMWAWFIRFMAEYSTLGQVGPWGGSTGTRYTVHGTRCTVHGARYTVHGTRYTVHGARYTVHGTRYTVHGTRCPVPGQAAACEGADIQPCVGRGHGSGQARSGRLRPGCWPPGPAHGSGRCIGEGIATRERPCQRFIGVLAKVDVAAVIVV
jgi:hypothetical protein